MALAPSQAEAVLTAFPSQGSGMLPHSRVGPASAGGAGPRWEVKTAPPIPPLGSCQILVPAEAWESRDRVRKQVGVCQNPHAQISGEGRPPEQVWREVGVHWHLFGRTCASLVAG